MVLGAGSLPTRGRMRPHQHRISSYRAPMKSLSFLATSLLLSTTALAGDIQVTGVGQVIGIDPDPLTGALAGVTVGDSFEMTVEVFDTPTILGFGARTYPVDEAAGGVVVGPVTFGYDTPSQELVIVNGAFSGDQLTVGVEIDAPGNLLAIMLLTDASGLTLPTEDLSQLVGMTFVQPPTSLVAGINPDDGSSSPTVVVQLTEIRIDDGGTIGGGSGPYCTAAPNSTGGLGMLTATGSFVASDNDVTLNVSGLPANTFGFFVNSQTPGFVVGPAGSAGNLCLGGGIGRYIRPGQIQNGGAAGAFSMALDLTQTPTPSGPVSVVAGETWNFQAWHRDTTGGLATSNFTNGFRVEFQ